MDERQDNNIIENVFTDADNGDISQLVLMSGNRNKFREIEQLVASTNIKLHSIYDEDNWQADMQENPVPPEDAPTFIENALIKARYGARITSLACLADDSGIIVPALVQSGASPGVQSARYANLGTGGTSASGNSDDAANRHKLLKEMKGLTGKQRLAYFVCYLVVVRHPEDPAPIVAKSSWQGLINEEEKGNGGFGYDPIFYIPERGKTAAELSDEEKNSISHRGKALQILLSLLK